MKAAELVLQVACLLCRHKSILSDQTLASFGIKPEAPIATFVRRLRCGKCGSGSVIASRIATNENCNDCLTGNTLLGAGPSANSNSVGFRAAAIQLQKHRRSALCRAGATAPAERRRPVVVPDKCKRQQPGEFGRIRCRPKRAREACKTIRPRRN